MNRNDVNLHFQAHRRQFRLHDPNRRHGAQRYHPYPRNEEERNPNARGTHQQYYQYEWETELNRWMWLRPNRLDRTYARCIVCHTNLRAWLFNIQRHEDSDGHVDRMVLINIPFDPQFDPHLNRNQFEDQKATIKLLLCAAFADEGIAFEKLDRLLPVIKKIAEYPGALQATHFTRTDMPKIMSRVIAPIHKQELSERLLRSTYATLFDESTGVSKDKHGCLLIRFADTRTYKIRTVLWDLIPVYRADDEEGNEAAGTLYDLIIDSLFDVVRAEAENRVVLHPDNYLASCTDGCNTMVGVHNSVAQRLSVDFPGINNIKCPCHSCHLCASHAIATFRVIVLLLKACYNWICSAKRLHALTQHQRRLGLPRHSLKRFVETRWLTGVPALDRLEEQIEAVDATLVDNPDNAQAMQLLRFIRSPSIRCINAFLIFVLAVIEDLNGWFQTEEVILPEAFRRICVDFKDILLCYMDEDHVENANLIDFDPENPGHFLNDEDMRIGVVARERAQQLPPEEYGIVMQMIRNYLIHLATEMLERLVIPWARFQCCESLLMRNTLSAEYHRENEDIIHQLMDQFPRAMPQGVGAAIIQEQWDELLNEELLFPDDLTTDCFWFIVRSINNGDGFHPYEHLANFMINILCTPHGNAQPERIWSIEKYIKNKWRNRLLTETVRSILEIQAMLALQGCSKAVENFHPSPAMIAAVRNGQY